jgi:hypothetical protein
LFKIPAAIIWALLPTNPAAGNRTVGGIQPVECLTTMNLGLDGCEMMHWQVASCISFIWYSHD